MDEQRALKTCLAGSDPRAFEFLVEKYRREAFYHALGFMGNEHDAADVCQEAFTRAYIALPKLQSIQHFYPWYYRILKNLCLNILKRRKRANAYTESDGQVNAKERLPADPAVLAERGEEQEEVWKVLGGMDVKFREILVLKHFQGLNYSQISERLGIPRGTVMSRLFHARKKFQSLFELQEKQREDS